MPPRKATPKKTKKCSSCGFTFPVEATVTINGKTYCEKCGEIRKQEIEDLKTLRDYIKLKMDPDDDLWPLITRQIKQNKEEYNMSYSGMYAALKYLFEYREKDDAFEYDIEKGISFVAYFYRQARLFFARMNKTKKENSEDKINECLNIAPIQINLKRSEIVAKDKEFEEKKKIEERKLLLNLDDVEDDGFIVDDFYYIDINKLKGKGENKS